ncbi:hypothetical protein TNCV_233311 [Trichonephila clavipes]|nr:hypothetical protein TNCV_233311 [Trichonephila clavipes]
MDAGDVSKQTVLPANILRHNKMPTRKIPNQHFQGSSSLRHSTTTTTPNDNANNKTKRPAEQTGLSPTSERPLWNLPFPESICSHIIRIVIHAFHHTFMHDTLE